MLWVKKDYILLLNTKIIVIKSLSQLEDEVLNPNRRTILALIYLSGGHVKRFSRLQLGMYALKELKVHTYDFHDHSPWGNADSQFRRDLNVLCGLINFDIDIDSTPEKTKHALYTLSIVGKIFAKEFISNLEKNDPDKFEELCKISKYLRDPPSGDTSIKLYNRFIKSRKTKT